MNTQETVLTMAAELRRHHEVCREFLTLFTEENQALRSPETWSATTFTEKRKRLLPQLESVLIALRNCRQWWERMSADDRARCGEINTLLRDIQNLLPRILLLDRENQQEMLRRGAVPATQLPSVASQRPHFVTGLYQRHAAA